MKDFAWETAESSIPRWTLKLAIIFGKTGDLAAYRQVCAASQFNDPLLPVTARHVSLFPLSTPADAIETFLVDGKDLAFRAEWGWERHVPQWLDLIDGVSGFRAGHLEAAAAALAKAREAFNLHCACVALAYGAQLECSRGQQATAEQYLAKAKSILTQLQQNQPGDLGRRWFDIAWAELAIDQAESALRNEAAQLSQFGTGQVLFQPTQDPPKSESPL